jgi:hypothetical protein
MEYPGVVVEPLAEGVEFPLHPFQPLAKPLVTARRLPERG